MQFNLFRHDGKVLAVPVVFSPGEFLTLDPSPELIGTVRIDPHAVSHEIITAVGLQGFAELHEDDLKQFGDALGSDLSTERRG